MSSAAKRLQPSPAPTPTREAVAYDPGGPVGALYGDIEARLASMPVSPADPLTEGRIAAASRLAGPVALVAAYIGIAALLFA